MMRRTMVADLVEALARVDRVLAKGEPIHHGAWRTQPVEVHVKHAVDHLRAWEAGDRGEPHLDHATTRCLMALALVLAAEATAP